ncbi:MAG: type VI secretion system baseplate subunit TssE [Pseudomonadota bacterium]|nr:type VI secretion system baseplate subunit TssE [Pseudomonadota bacterium]
MVIDVRNRLQPALLDRLTNDEPTQRAEAESGRVMSKAQLRQAVLRDLSALFNAVQPLGVDAEAYPAVAASVLNFGLPALSGQLASRLDVSIVEAAIREAIVRFEPRILKDTLEVKARESESVLDTHNVIEFEIRGQLWSQPVPLEILLRTQLDLEAGQVEVRDTLAPSAKAH